MVESPLLEVFTMPLDRVLGNLGLLFPQNIRSADLLRSHPTWTFNEKQIGESLGENVDYHKDI